MSSKEAKASLKDAREAIKNKKFSEAIKLCNKVLKEQNDNYMALLLLGAAYQDSDKKEAASYLKRAVACTDEPVVALQGLSNCADDSELPGVCEKLLSLVPDKYADLHGKLYGVASRGGALGPTLRVFEKELDQTDANRQQSAYELLAKIVAQNADLEQTEASLVTRVLEREINNNQDIYQHDKFRRFLKLLHEEKRYDRIASISAAMHERFSNDMYPLEWICKLYTEKIVPKERLAELLPLPIEVYVDRALAIAPDSALVLLTKGKILFAAGQIAEAEAVLKRANDQKPLWVPCMELLAEIYFRQKAYGLAEALYRNMNMVNLNYAIALVNDGTLEKLREADKCFTKLQDASSKDLSEDLLFYWCKAKLLLSDRSAADKNLAALKTINGIKSDKIDYLSALRAKADGNNEEAVRLLAAHETSSCCQLELSTILASMSGREEESFYAALRATKLDPNNAECFYRLGKLYLQRGDKLRARKCLEKSVRLNPAARNAVILLSELYRREAEWDANATLLSSSGTGAAWAQLLLGLHHLDRQEYDEAIGAFRTVLRFEVDNSTAWEGLADAYLGRGSYTSAMKVYGKITERDPNNPYPLLQLANIKNSLKLNKEGLALFEQLLARHENYFPAIKGIADSHLGLCFYRRSQRMLGRSRDHAQSCVDYLTKAIKMKPNFVCLWHQLAKVLDTIACFPKIYSHLQLEGGLAGLSDNQQRPTLRRGKLAELASRCYARLVKLDPGNDTLWYELASNYYRRAVALNEAEMPKTEDDDRRKRLLSTAYEMGKHSIVLNSARWQNWNLLGVICTTEEINDRALAQHCFIQAVETERKVCAPAWSNLGVLYLSNGDLGMANKAFSRAQQCDPTFQNAWIGQAIIAECAGHPDEAMDLFRHCTQLGYHPESSLGYAHWVCMVMADESYRDNERYRFAIDDMHALAVSHDSITWHCAHRGDEATVPALRFLGNISSRLGLWRTATDAYYRALGAVDRESSPADNTARDEILCDLGYCLMKLQRYSEAVKCYQDMRSEPSFTGSIGRAQAFFRATQYQESYEEYEKALNYHAKTDLDKAYVLIAMSAMVYAFQGEADAKTILFQCITLPEPPVEALFSACALGLLHKDNMLTELVIKELRKYEDNATHGHNVVYLVSQFYWQNNLKNKCLAYLVSQVHRHPNRPKLWQILSIALLRKFHAPKNLLLASRAAQSALRLDLADRRSRTRADDAARWLTVASEAVGQVDVKKHRILAQKAIHLDPTSREALTAFRHAINPVDSWENV
ncbi:tetratricopeptide repeat protein 37 [Anopheles aquasalis]|uniref:tetratricopeptide repeat protein 37 n=1 Tax=Anopheles aquasalis TaxID=42839 RepID=UPI00215A729F|nr:tetratricopeptide repeat protein 37 [Anopheles aquasalis]